jgi:glycosyltransferase involved in cell wall biosynthesis
MHSDPIQNNPKDPLISILVYNYDKQYLRQCMDSIFNQDILKNFEVILIDDATRDGSWDIAMEFLSRYPNRITVNRNRRVLGPQTNECLFEGMVKGRYCALLKNDQAFLPEYIKNCVRAMISDPHAGFNLVRRVAERRVPAPNLLNRPLVSILCYNYNYGRYLRQCLESVFAQTYENIELCFSDNGSTDDSWAIALEFARKYPEKMNLTRNRKNFGSDDNFANCLRSMQGEYFVIFCSDDALEPEYAERCVNALEARPNVGLAIVNRAVIDEHGRRTEEPPFYDQSCIIPGEEQAAVYMMAGVNPSVSQIMYRRAIVDARSATGGLASRYYGTRIMDFNISIDFDIAYVKEPLLLHRIHSQSDANHADANLLPVIGMYVLNHQFADTASVRNLTKVTDRLPKSLDKLAHLSVRYSVRSLLAKDEQVALRYFHLAIAINPQLAGDPVWQQLQEYWTADAPRKSSILEQLGSSDNLASRTISYDPPSGSIPIDLDGKAFPPSTSLRVATSK